MSPAILGTVKTTAWMESYTRAHCSHCPWSTDRGSDRKVTRDAQGHVAGHPGHIVAVDRGQTRYVQSGARLDGA